MPVCPEPDALHVRCTLHTQYVLPARCTLHAWLTLAKLVWKAQFGRALLLLPGMAAADQQLWGEQRVSSWLSDETGAQTANAAKMSPRFVSDLLMAAASTSLP